MSVVGDRDRVATRSRTETRVTNYDIDDVRGYPAQSAEKGCGDHDRGRRPCRPSGSTRSTTWLKVNKVELAVVGELLLRGPQTEGDLRARASRMEPLADLGAVQAILDALAPARAGPLFVSARPEAGRVCHSWAVPARRARKGSSRVCRQAGSRGRGTRRDFPPRVRDSTRRPPRPDGSARWRRSAPRARNASTQNGRPHKRDSRPQVAARHLTASSRSPHYSGQAISRVRQELSSGWDVPFHD